MGASAVSKEREIRDLKAEIRRLKNADPLRNNDILIRAVENAIQLLAIKRATPAFGRSELAKPEYLRQFIPMALDPTVTVADMAERLGVRRNAIRHHLEALNGYLSEFLTNSVELRDSGLGYGWVKSYDIEEKRELFEEEQR